MSGRPNNPKGGDGDIITIILVDDIPETRENIKKLLAFEPDFKVVGTAGTGREGVALAQDVKPDIIIMDINMPDMDGIQATTQITEAVPTAAVIMMSVQNDPDYLRRAMLAGARNFLTKPIDMDELYNTIRTVYARHKPIRDQYQGVTIIGPTAPSKTSSGGGDRAGNIIVVYSPQGGAGSTTIATNLASGLMREGSKVLLVDSDLQFGDVGVFLNLQASSTLYDLVGSVDDLDTELFENIVVTHDSGLKVLMGPNRLEMADEIITNHPTATAQIIEKIANNYDFVVVDTARHLDEMLLSLMELATKIVLVATPTLASVKNVRLILDLFTQLKYADDKSLFILNRVHDERQQKGVSIPTAAIEKHLKRQVFASIPLDEIVVLNAVNKGIPVIASQRDRNRSPIREMLDFAERTYTLLMGNVEPEIQDADKQRKKSGLGLRLGR
jgi:pilus assembly protein CpaE